MISFGLIPPWEKGLESQSDLLHFCFVFLWLLKPLFPHESPHPSDNGKTQIKSPMASPCAATVVGGGGGVEASVVCVCEAWAGAPAAVLPSQAGPPPSPGSQGEAGPVAPEGLLAAWAVGHPGGGGGVSGTGSQGEAGTWRASHR